MIFKPIIYFCYKVFIYLLFFILVEMGGYICMVSVGIASRSSFLLKSLTITGQSSGLMLSHLGILGYLTWSSVQRSVLY